MRTTKEILNAANSVKSELLGVSESEKNILLNTMADCILKNAAEILSANVTDVNNAKGKISEVMIDRLSLDPHRIAEMAKGIRNVTKTHSQIGKISHICNHDSGLYIRKVRVPLGVVAIIYESRPNVTADAAALCIKSGNSCILRGGKEAFNTSFAITKALKEALHQCGFSTDLVNLIEDTSRESAKELMTAKGQVDLLIPRGGKGLITACTENATVPVIETGTGICHIYVDKHADLKIAADVVENAKASRPSVCNAAEVCLVARSVAKEFLPQLYNRLTITPKYHTVKIIGDSEVCEIIDAIPATEQDFDTEFLDYILAIKIVEDVKEAITHINSHSTHHSESIITDDLSVSNHFLLNVDSAAVYVNASTRFTDGGEFGLGCEMGISTQKLHARGPMGVKELSTYKYLITGNGQTRG